MTGFRRWLRELPPPMIAAGILATASRHAGIPFPPRAAAVGILGAFCVYWGDHWIGTAARTDFPRHRGLWLPILPAAALLLVITWTSPAIRTAAVAGYLLLALAYVFPWLPGGKRLQDLPGLRTAAICLGWTLIPFLLSGWTLRPAHLLFLGGWCGFLTPNVLLNDAAHREKDEAAGRPTWAGSLSPPAVTALSMASLAASMGFSLLAGGMWPLLIPAGVFAVVVSAAGARRAAAWADWILCLPLALELARRVYFS